MWIEAFQSRGKNDFLASHDFEDIITVIAGRENIAEEIALTNEGLSTYLQVIFKKIISNNQFAQALPGHLNDGPVTLQRVKTVMDRIQKIVNLGQESK